MPNFDPELIQVMRHALEEIMKKVPLEYATQATKAYLAECILKAAAQGRTSYDALGVCPSIRFDRFRREFDFAKSAI